MSAQVNFTGDFFLWNDIEEFNNQSPQKWRTENIPEGLNISRQDLMKCGVPMTASLKYSDGDGEEIWGRNLDDLLIERIKENKPAYKDKIILMKHPYYFYIKYD